jgi:uncharacterized repeat protein (TIGR01451 family)
VLALYRRLRAAALRDLCLPALVAAGLLPALASGASPGTVILNQATLSATSVPTVQAAVSVKVSSVGFLRYVQGDPGIVVPAPQNLAVQPVQCGGTTLAVPAFGAGGAGDLPALPSTYSLSVATEYQVGEPVFLQVTDPAANLAAGARDVLSITVSNPGTGDSETLLLQETAANSGDFVGFINTTRNPAAADCRLSVREADMIHADYGVERTDDVGLVDPAGFVFDATTGARLTGASVTLIDDLTGLPATVFGDFGEPYPATVTTGGTVTTSATTYTLQPGEYRFPFVAPGRSYHLVTTFANHVFPTGRPDSAFTTPAFAGYVVTAGSRGESFTVNSGLPVRIDLPLDPVTSGLLLVKSALRTVVAIGDFVPYDVVASNRSGGLLTGINLRDVLPPGFRYRAGSLRLNGVTQADPQVGSDGRTLDITVGTLANNADARVTYVAEATAATPLGEAVNLAQASSGVVQSNQASATVRVREDLMRSRAILTGRVLEVNSCSKDDIAAAKPLPGARIYLEDGRYVITDKLGRWHLDDLRPGTHVVQLDEQGLPKGGEILDCDRNTRSAGSPYSRFADLQGGTLWQVDFFVQKARPLHMRMEELQRQFALRLTSERSDAGLRYTLHFRHAATRVDNAVVEVLLPKDLEFVKGSLKVDGESRGDPAFTGTGWTQPLPELATASDLGEHTLTFELRPAADARPGHHAVRAMLAGDYAGVALEQDILENQAAVVVPEKLGKVIIFRPRFATYSTELSAADKRWLDGILDELREAGDIRLEIVGHTDNVRVVPRKGRKINDNYALSQARAQSVADYLQEKLGLPAERVQAFGKGPDEPIADNATAKGKESNRRVELKVFAVSKAEDTHLDVQSGDSGERGKRWSEWQAVLVDEPAAVEADAARDTPPAPADDGMGLLSHRDGEVVADRIQALRIRVDSRLKTEITLDGRPIPDDRLGFRKTEGNNTLMSYVGVDFGEAGPHVVHVRGVDPFGIARIDQKVKVIVASDITRIRVAKSPENVADGRTPVAVKVELVDASGRVVPAAVDLRLVNHGGLRPLVTSDAERALSRSAGKVPVAADGLMKFAPVTRSGLYTLEVAYNNAVEKIPVYVKPEKREWILVALAEGSLAAKTVSGNMQAANAAGASDDLWQDGRTAFFAKGQIKGKWLLTMAYDSNRERATAFGGAINPEQFYTLYADAADPRADAPSKEKLYLRIEKDAFYALFGDFDTGMTEVELGRYTRALTGLKTEYHDARYDLNFFAADTGRGFVRDEMRGDGTSGLYRLRTQRVIAGSDRVRIETRDRFKSEVVLASQTLSRWADYNIDYHRGEIFFKAPVPSQDASLNPVWIVVEYETELNGGDALNAGGRAAVKFEGGRGVVGVSTVQEENGIQQGKLNAVDASYRVTPADTLRIELAGSAVDTLAGSRDGNAQLLEWKRDSQKLKGRAYVREQEGGFGLGQQSGTEDGTRKLGVEGRYQLWQDTAITADIFQQEMLASGASRQVLDLRRETTRDRYAYGIGLRHVDEQMGVGNDRTAQQLALSGRYAMPNKKVKLRSNVELGLAGSSESMDFPDRFLVGADYQAHKKVLFQLEQEWATSQLQDTENTRFGIQTQPWLGARIGTTLDHEARESGERLRGNLGLGQALTLTPQWTADLGYDHAATLRSTANPVFNPALPPAFGAATADFWAASAGANYRHADIKGIGRIERREADDEKRWNFVGGYYRELNPEIAVAVGLTAALAKRDSGVEEDSILLRGSLAWRPDDAHWILLDRLDYGVDSKTNALGSYEGKRLVNNLNANRRWDDNQLALQYGSKFVFDTIDATSYSGYTDLIGVEWRRDIDERWDIGWQNSLLHSWEPGIMDMGYGLSVGYTPMRNAWVSLGYNFEGFTDADFSAGEYSAQGLYLKLRLKVDQHSIRQIWSDARGVFGRGSDAAATAAPAQGEAAPAAAAPEESAEAPAAVPATTGAELDRLAAPVPDSTTLLPAQKTPAPVMMKVIDPYAAAAAAEAEAAAAAAAAAPATESVPAPTKPATGKRPPAGAAAVKASAAKSPTARTPAAKAPAAAVPAGSAAASVPVVSPRAVGKNPAQAQRIEETRAKLKRRVETQERRERLKQKATSLEEVQAELAAEDAASAGKYSETSLERERRRERKLRRERLDQKKQQVQKVLKSAQN